MRVISLWPASGATSNSADSDGGGHRCSPERRPDATEIVPERHRSRSARRAQFGGFRRRPRLLEIRYREKRGFRGAKQRREADRLGERPVATGERREMGTEPLDEPSSLDVRTKHVHRNDGDRRRVCKPGNGAPRADLGHGSSVANAKMMPMAVTSLGITSETKSTDATPMSAKTTNAPVETPVNTVRLLIRRPNIAVWRYRRCQFCAGLRTGS